jgi:hypothetical protein
MRRSTYFPEMGLGLAQGLWIRVLTDSEALRSPAGFGQLFMLLAGKLSVLLCLQEIYLPYILKSLS